MTNSDRELALVYSHIAMMNCEVAGMVAENMQRAAVGSSMAYSEEAFVFVANKYASLIGHNAIFSIPLEG